MKTMADLHTHTNVSQHAYSSLDEMARAAKATGMTAFGIADHGPEMMDGAIAHHFLCMKGLPKQIYGMRFFTGAETNIKAFEGILDLPNQILDSLDFVVASYHVEAIEPASSDEHTNGWLEVIKNPLVDCLGHMGNPVFTCDYETIIKECKSHRKLVEINSNSFVVRPGSEKNCKVIAELCKQYNVPVIVSSDAHSCYGVANHKDAIALLESINFPERLVVNASEKQFGEFFYRT